MILLTSFLFCLGDGFTLKHHLVDEFDYDPVPEEAWFKLVSWYGMTSDQQALQRKVVVRHGMHVKSPKVEVYLMEFQLSQHSDPQTLVTRKFSKGDSIGEFQHPREISRQRSTAVYECESWSEGRKPLSTVRITRGLSTDLLRYSHSSLFVQ